MSTVFVTPKHMTASDDTTFRVYESIGNHNNPLFLNTILTHAQFDPNSLWSASEKVHGANFSFTIIPENDAITVKVASRNQYLDTPEWMEKFYPKAQQILRDQYTTLSERAFYYIVTKYPQFVNVHKVVIYGEVLGGLYPHDEVPKDKTAGIIQRGVYYSPNNLFYPFDIHVTHGDQGTWLNHDEFEDVMQNSGFTLYAKELFRGPLSACLELDVEKATTLPALLGLPPIEKNVSEGLVFKPLKPFTDETGTRWIVKKKSYQFMEAMTGDRVKIFLAQKQGVLLPLPNEASKKVMELVASYVTDSRIDSVRSKMKEDLLVNQHVIGRATGELAKDVLVDVEKEHGNIWSADVVKKDEQHLIRKNLNTLCTTQIREYIRRYKESQN